MENHQVVPNGRLRCLEWRYNGENHISNLKYFVSKLQEWKTMINYERLPNTDQKLLTKSSTKSHVSWARPMLKVRLLRLNIEFDDL